MEQTIEYRGYKIEVKHDSDPESPNDWGCYGDPNISGLLEEAKSVIDNLINKNE